jgi:DDE superfamily endonuclease
MELLGQVDQILLSLRPVFRRRRAFDMFVLVTWALMLRLDMAGVTSIVRCLGLAPSEYYNLLHFFHADSFRIKELCAAWLKQVFTHLTPVQINGSPLVLADSIKVGRTGQRMPGVKLLHQESEDNSKPEFIMGHHFGAVAAAVEAGRNVFALPLRLQIQEGLKRSPTDAATLVSKMASLLVELLAPETSGVLGATVVADAYYASHVLLRALVLHGIGYVGRIRISTVAYLAPPQRKKGQRGRPRTYGDKVVLRELFNKPEQFDGAEVELYGEVKQLHYYVCDLIWHGLLVRFVLTIYPDGKEIILITTHRLWSAEDIIRAYELRFKIEVTFKALVHVLFAFCYHFWMKAWPKTQEGDKSVYLHRKSPKFRKQVARKIEAYERFVNIAGIALGILQWLAIRSPQLIWDRFPVWLRTLTKHGCPTEHVVRLTLQHELHQNFLKSRSSTLLEKILTTRQTVPESPHPIRLTA